MHHISIGPGAGWLGIHQPTGLLLRISYGLGRLLVMGVCFNFIKFCDMEILRDFALSTNWYCSLELKKVGHYL